MSETRNYLKWKKWNMMVKINIKMMKLMMSNFVAQTKTTTEKMMTTMSAVVPMSSTAICITKKE